MSDLNRSAEEIMGLDASVYRDDAEAERLFTARIGNSASVGELAEVIESRVPTASLLLKKVLYSGTHCGDSIPKEEVAQLEVELAEVRAKFAGDHRVQEFAETFGAVIEVALRYHRPITF